MLESIDAKRAAAPAKSAVLPPSRFEITEGKSIILAADVPHGTEPAGWSRDGKLITHDSSNKEQPRFRSFERLLNGEASADFDCFLARQASASQHNAPSTIRAYLAIDSTCTQDSGSYELFVRTKQNPGSVIAWATANIRVLPQSDSAKKRKVDSSGALSSELPSVHYPHPMAPVFIRALPDKVYVDAGDTVQFGCRLWGLPNSFVGYESPSSQGLLLKKATLA